jgi:putative transposase
MKGSKFSDAQKAFILKQGDDGVPVAEICRKAGISQATYFNWRKKYAGLLPDEMRRLKALEDENSRLKKIVADLTLDREMLQDVIRRNVWSTLSLQGSLAADECSLRNVWSTLSLQGSLAADECSLRKCIRPLASGLRLQSGPDEIRTSCFQIATSGTKPSFSQDLQNADQLSRHHPRTSQSVWPSGARMAMGYAVGWRM